MEGGEPYKVVEEIRANKFGIGLNVAENSLAEDLHESIRHLAAELYQKDLHFVMELIQNADDNVYEEGVVPNIEFVLVEADIVGIGVEWTLLVLNNEVGFSKANVESLCSIGRSTKKGKRDSHGYIGEKGIGFKSVFLITHNPVVISNGYRIQFHDAPTESVDLGFIVPQWAHQPSNAELCEFLNMTESELPNTIILLPIRKDKVQAMRAQLFQLSPQLVLFLKKIEKLSVRQLSNKHVVLKEITVQRYITPLPQQCDRMLENDCSYSMVRLCSAGQEIAYHVWQQEFPVNEDHEVDHRRHVRSWMVTLAFPLKDDYKDTDIYSFLPTKLTVGFPFIINADFLLVSSRDTIRFDSVWNKGIMLCIPDAFISAFEFLLKSANVITGFSSSLKDVYNYIPHKEVHVKEFSLVQEKILKKIKSEDIILLDTYIGQHLPGVQSSILTLDKISTSGQGLAVNIFCKPSSARTIYPEFRELLQKAYKVGIQPPMPLTSHNFYVVDAGLEDSFAALQAIGVQPLMGGNYVDFLSDSLWLRSLPEPLYVELLVFISQRQLKSSIPKHVPLLKYVDGNNNIQLMASRDKDRVSVFYTLKNNDVSMLSQWTSVFQKWIHVHFMSTSTVQAIHELNDKKRAELFAWMFEFAGIHELSVETYARKVVEACRERKEEAFVIAAIQFIVDAREQGHLDDNWKSISRRLPVLDSKSGARLDLMGPVLLPGSISIWPRFLVNDSWKGKAVFLSELYLTSPSLIGDEISEGRMIRFLRDAVNAVDLFEVMNPPDAPIIIPSPWELPADDVKSFLVWLEELDYYSLRRLKPSLQQAAWVRTVNHGSKEPSLTFLDMGKWRDILTPVDVPFVDMRFYGDLSPSCSVLKDLGMVMDVEGGAQAVAEHIEGLSQKGFIAVHSDTANRWYRYLRKRNWTRWLDRPALQVIWVPGGRKGDTTLGCWCCAGDCVMADSGGLFHDRLIVLERYYKDPDVLKFFEEDMGVSPSPGTEKYCSLWLNWSEATDGTVCRSHFEDAWRIIASGWNSFSSKPSVELTRFLKRCRIPCSSMPVGAHPSTDGDGDNDVDAIVLARPKEVLYADNLLLAEIFAKSCPALSFAWYPRSAASASWADALVRAYKALGVQSLSDALLSVGPASKVGVDRTEQVCEGRMMGRGVYRAILGYLADAKLKVLAPARKRMVLELSGVEVCHVQQVGEVEYTVLVDGEKHVAKRRGLVRWEKGERRIYVGTRPMAAAAAAAGGCGKAQAADELADELAKGVVGVERAALAEGLREILFSAAGFGFDDHAVQYLLLRRNLRLALEDEAVLADIPTYRHSLLEYF